MNAPANSKGHVLEVQGLTRRFGGLTAVSDVSFQVERGEIFGIIGPNGAGKTTLFNVIAGHFRPSAGTVTFEGQDISGQTSDAIGRLGIARTFQAVNVFKEHTVAENLRRADVAHRCHNPWAWLSHRNSAGRADAHDVARFLGLDDSMQGEAGSLAYGDRKSVV